MVVDYNHYIGPYLKVTKRIEQKEIDFCVNHNFPPSAKYCPECGCDMQNRFSYTTVEVDAPEYLRLNESLFSPISKDSLVNKTRTCIYLPNKFWEKLGITELMIEQEFSFDLIDAEKSKQKFFELFFDEIKYLQMWFTAEVKFGYISYTS